MATIEAVSDSENIRVQVREFLLDVMHGPCATSDIRDVLKSITDEAERIMAESNLEQAGAYGRTIDRWWSGFYTGRVPSIAETAGMSVYTIAALIADASRRRG